VLLVGGTGMLSGLARMLAPLAASLTLASRNPQSLARELGISSMHLDWAAPAQARADLAGEGIRYDLVISWLHDEAVAFARDCENLLRADGRSVRIHGSLSVDPAIRARRDPDPRPGVHRQTVILGWFADPAAEDGKRWLTDAEICAGTLQAILKPSAVLHIIGDMNG
jgi:hypothetical protein